MQIKNYSSYGHYSEVPGWLLLWCGVLFHGIHLQLQRCTTAGSCIEKNKTATLSANTFNLICSTIKIFFFLTKLSFFYTGQWPGQTFWGRVASIFWLHGLIVLPCTSDCLYSPGSATAFSRGVRDGGCTPIVYSWVREDRHAYTMTWGWQVRELDEAMR